MSKLKCGNTIIRRFFRHTCSVPGSILMTGRTRLNHVCLIVKLDVKLWSWLHLLVNTAHRHERKGAAVAVTSPELEARVLFCCYHAAAGVMTVCTVAARLLLNLQGTVDLCRPAPCAASIHRFPKRKRLLNRGDSSKCSFVFPRTTGIMAYVHTHRSTARCR